MSCYNGVELPPSPENASQSPTPPPRRAKQSQFLPSCAHRTGSSQLSSPQVKCQNDRQDHPQEEDKGKPGLHESPYAARREKKTTGGGFKHKKSAEEDRRGEKEVVVSGESRGRRMSFLSIASTATCCVLEAQHALKI